MINDIAIKQYPIESENKFGIFGEFLNKFMHSFYYFGLLVILSFVAYITKIPEICIVPTFILFGLSLIFVDDITPVIMAIFIIPSCLPSGTTPDNALYLIFYLPICLVPAVYHIIKYKANKKWGKFALPQLVVSIALILGGIGSTISAEQYSKGLVQAMTLGFLTLILYLLCINYFKPQKDFDLFVAKAMTAIGFSLVLDHFVVLFFNPDYKFIEVTHDIIGTGAYVSTNMAMLYLVTAPFAFYIGSKKTKMNILYYFLGMLEFAACFFTYSKGGILMMLVTLPCCIIYSLFKANNKKTTWLYFGIFFIIALAVVLTYLDNFKIIIKNILEIVEDSNLNEFSSGRILLYKEGLEVFCMFPLFGAGMGYTSPTQINSVIDFFQFHSTFIQIIACMGMFGLVAYAYNYIVKYKIICKSLRKSTFSAFVLFAMLGFEGYSMIDCGMFIPMPFVFLVTILVAAIEQNNIMVEVKK